MQDVTSVCERRRFLYCQQILAAVLVLLALSSSLYGACATDSESDVRRMCASATTHWTVLEAVRPGRTGTGYFVFDASRTNFIDWSTLQSFQSSSLATRERRCGRAAPHRDIHR